MPVHILKERKMIDHNLLNVATCRLNLAICESALAAMRAITTNPDASKAVDKHNDACADAYFELENAYGQDESVLGIGTEEEWHALSNEQRIMEWEEFHDKCAQGIGDEMYFYEVLMSQWLVGYCGH